ncbi:MAG: hypothetical protein GY832_30805 [Chloroflexi bacterium]|nr:hypothetical protein [Chloroflexota bacterium]
MLHADCVILTSWLVLCGPFSIGPPECHSNNPSNRHLVDNVTHQEMTGGIRTGVTFNHALNIFDLTAIAKDARRYGGWIKTVLGGWLALTLLHSALCLLLLWMKPLWLISLHSKMTKEHRFLSKFIFHQTVSSWFLRRSRVLNAWVYNQSGNFSTYFASALARIEPPVLGKNEPPP